MQSYNPKLKIGDIFVERPNMRANEWSTKQVQKEKFEPKILMISEISYDEAQRAEVVNFINLKKYTEIDYLASQVYFYFKKL